ncbi:MAG TPA: hypothetical protein GX708_12420 [Gallicola sp.]|nr:hypothetical protein [Gallicola sp.]
MSEKKYDGWDELENVETINESDQKHQKFKEWDNIIGIDNSVSESNDSKINLTKPIYTTTNGTNTQYSKVWGVIGIIGFAIFFVLVIIPLFSGGGSTTLTSGSGYKVVGNVNLYGDGAYIDAKLKVTQSGAYQVNVSIYSSSGQYLGSNNQIYYLSAGDEASVYFYIPNIMSREKPTKYSVSVTKGW